MYVKILLIHVNLNVHVIRMKSILTKLCLYVTFLKKALKILKENLTSKTESHNVCVAFTFVV